MMSRFSYIIHSIRHVGISGHSRDHRDHYLHHHRQRPGCRRCPARHRQASIFGNIWLYVVVLVLLLAGIACGLHKTLGLTATSKGRQH